MNLGNPAEIPDLKPVRRNVPSWRLVLAAVLWVGFVFAVYFVLPNAWKQLHEFGARVSPLTEFLFLSAGFVLPLLALIAGLTWIVSRSKRLRLLTLMGIPLAGIAFLALVVGADLFGLVKDLQ